MISTTVRLTPALHQAAKAQGEPMAEVIRKALEAYLCIHRSGGLAFQRRKAKDEYVVPASVVNEAKDILLKEDKSTAYVLAIKYVRSSCGLGLAEAKHVIDTLRAVSK